MTKAPRAVARETPAAAPGPDAATSPSRDPPHAGECLTAAEAPKLRADTLGS
jgi:hypothetical protein